MIANSKSARGGGLRSLHRQRIPLLAAHQLARIGYGYELRLILQIGTNPSENRGFEKPVPICS
jgi:hypothetical protein